MLLELSVRDFILIDKLNIEFDKGLNVLTGETGAGKSIVIDAINVALGDKSNKEMIRNGAEKSIIQLTFLMERQAVIDEITSLGVDLEDDLLIISREIFGTGRSVVRINGRVTPISILRKVSSLVIDIHGQHEHQSLMNSKNHLSLLDSYEKNKNDLTDLGESFKVVDDLIKERESITFDSKDFERKIDLLNFQIEEIDALDLNPDKDKALEEEFELQKNSENISTSLERSYDLITSESEGFSIKDMIDTLSKELEFPAKFSEVYGDLYERVQGISYQLDDLSTEVRVAKDSLSIDFEQLANMENRLDAINNLKRKYGNSIDEILNFNEKLYEELESLKKSQNRVQHLNEYIDSAKIQYYTSARIVSNNRCETGKELETLILKELHELNMEKARFKISVEDDFNKAAEKAIRALGYDHVEFMISTNPGKDLGKMSKIASGGELSRIMLALKVITAHIDNIGTMIFDEIDTGISGQTASIVGKKMSYLSKSHQIICITHLPQIASKGDAHFVIKKSHAENETITSIERLKRVERVEEIARLISGDNITELSLANATEMLKNN